MNPAVSVVIPTYNASGYIQQNLESVFSQSFLPQEIVVVDDASTDGTPDFIERLARTSPVPFRLFRQSQNTGGPAGPLNVGITNAIGPLIATLDHDDIMLPRKLELTVECYRRAGPVGLVFGKVACCQTGKPPPPFVLKSNQTIENLPGTHLGGPLYRVRSHDFYNALICHENFVCTCSNFLFPKSVWQESGRFDEQIRSACDFGFLERIGRRYDLGLVKEAVIGWNYRPDSFYKQSHRMAHCLDLIRIYSKFAPDRLVPQTKKFLERLLREEHLGAAYYLRENGDYLGSINHYFSSIHQGGWNWKAFWGLGKLIPHRLIHWSKEKTDSNDNPTDR